MKALEVNGLCKRYENFALDNVTFSLEQGTITGLVGRNGAGKTTILRSILGAAHIDAGTISFWESPSMHRPSRKLAWCMIHAALARC